MAGTGTELTRFRSGNQGGVSKCDAECDAISTDRVEVIARAVVLVARINRRGSEGAVLARLTAARASKNSSPSER